MLHGRIIFIRKQGGISFARLQMNEGARQQIAFSKAEWPSVEDYKHFISQLKIGTILRLEGKFAPSSTGEMTFWANDDSEILAQPQLPFPDKFKGLSDENALLRKRYLDCILDPETLGSFKLRHQCIQTIRNFLLEKNFTEVETPILSAHASGANARPFQTHLNSKNADLFLRIAPETYLKRYVTAGFDRVFEIGKNFRNEGIDPSHLPEFTSVEWYAAYQTHLDNLTLFQELFAQLVTLSPHCQNGKLSYQDTIIDLNNVSVCTYESLFEKYVGGRDWQNLSWKERDLLFKKKIRPNLIDPTYISNYPAEMAPLAARSTSDNSQVDMWQLVINGWELVKCYQELVDPDLQEQLLQQQMLEKTQDPEAMELEPDFIECMRYGMPPMSGLGLGIDRLVCLLANQDNLRNVVMFPILL